MRPLTNTELRVAPRRFPVLLGLLLLALSSSCGSGRSSPTAGESESLDATAARSTVGDGETALHVVPSIQGPDEVTSGPAIGTADLVTSSPLPPSLPAIIGRPACRTFHAEGWLMDCLEYTAGGAFLRDGTEVARRACAIGYGTWSDDGCPTERLLGTCEDRDFTLFYYPDPHQRITTDELRRGCETPSNVGDPARHGVFHPRPRPSSTPR